MLKEKTPQKIQLSLETQQQLNPLIVQQGDTNILEKGFQKTKEILQNHIVGLNSMLHL